MTGVPSPHGTNRCYINHKCRCAPCREANRLYEKLRRARHLRDMAANPHHRYHGTEYGYRCGCRCTPCTTAKSDKNAASLARKKGTP